jgi:SOS-response transcriptional repressor LexA
MNTLGSRIAHFRHLAGMSQAALARTCGWGSQSRVGNYEKNTREPSLDDINMMSHALGVSPQALLIKSVSGNVLNTQQPNTDARYFPLISWDAAGIWIDTEILPGACHSHVHIASHEQAGPRGYWLEIAGDSMIAQVGRGFPAGELILVQPEGFDVVSSKLYIAKLLATGEAMFRQYVRDAGVDYLRPLNPSYKALVMDDAVQLIGRVIDSRAPRSLF